MNTSPDFESIKQLFNIVTDENTQLSSTAMQSGVQSRNMGLFHDAGYQGMYTSKTLYFEVCNMLHDTVSR